MQDMIQAVVADRAVMNEVLFASSAIVGQILHAIKKWAEGDDVMFSNIRRTVAAIIGNLTAIIGAMAMGLGNLDISQAILAGLTLGLAANSVLNRGARREWSKERREAKK